MKEQISLINLCTLNMGQSPDSTTYNENKDGIPFYQGNADFGEIYPKNRIWCSAPVKIAQAGDILISVRAPIGALNFANEECCIGRGVAAITPIEEKCNKKYLYYALQSMTEDLQAKGTGSTFKAISKKVLEDVQIPIVTLPQQEKIASTLDKITSLISLHQKQMAKLDELVKARFVEMFGDTESNSKHIEIRKLGSISEKISDGVHAKPEYTVDGKPFLSVININTGKIVFDNCKYVSEESYKKMIKSTFPEKGDVLYTKVGATYGIPAYVDTDRKFCLYVSVCLIKPKHDEINSRFLSLQMGMPFIKHQADKRIKGIGVPDLHLNQIKDFDILCPRREDQEKYVDFAHKVEEAKKPIQESLNRLQTLKASLMQEYFS